MAYITLLCDRLEALTVIRKSHSVKSLAYIHAKLLEFLFFLTRIVKLVLWWSTVDSWLLRI